MNTLNNVKSAEEFISSLSSNMLIYLQDGTYDISYLQHKYNKNVYYEEVFDGAELHIKSINDLIIEGKSKDDTRIIASPRYANVLTFENCRNITLKNITLGHSPQEGSCAGGVLIFKSCTNIKIENVEMFGCGTFGIWISDSESVIINKSVITKCNISFFNITDSVDVHFIDCQIQYNKTNNSTISHSNNVVFSKCNFISNTQSMHEDYFMYIHDDCGLVKLENCLIQYHNRDYVFNSYQKDAPILLNVQIEVVDELAPSIDNE